MKKEKMILIYKEDINKIILNNNKVKTIEFNTICNNKGHNLDYKCSIISKTIKLNKNFSNDNNYIILDIYFNNINRYKEYYIIANINGSLNFIGKKQPFAFSEITKSMSTLDKDFLEFDDDFDLTNFVEVNKDKLILINY